MKITIDYESSWRNSFLDGSNNEALPKKGRNFIASMTNLKDAKNFIKREITHDTVMGILNRLIGDQRKLYQARNQTPYYFADLESLITFKDKPTRINDNEVTYIRNMLGNTDQNSFSGIIKVQDPLFLSDYSPEFWGVLALDFEEVCDFIIEESRVTKTIALNPISIIERLEVLDKEKTVANEGKVAAAKAILNTHFPVPDTEYLDGKGNIKPIMFYCSSLYLQLERLKERFADIDSAKTKAGGISGISKRGFTKKDFMKRFTTGSGKLIFGNPYIRKERVKGVGEVSYFMTKASGQLEIDIDIDRDIALKLKERIENAGVSSFYLGKKGLAYVSEINT